MRRRIPIFRGLHAEPPSWLYVLLAVLPFLLFLALYLTSSEMRHAANPQDKLLADSRQDHPGRRKGRLHPGRAQR